MNGIYLSIGAMILTVIGFLFQQFSVLAGVKERLTALETKMDLFWKAIEGNVIKLLKTYPTEIDKDVLLDKFSRRELSKEEAYQLRTILIGEMETTKTNNTLAYVLLIGRLEQILHENKNNCKTLWNRLFSI